MNILKGFFRFILILWLMVISFSGIFLIIYVMGFIIKDLGILYGILPALFASFGIGIISAGFAAGAGELMAGKSVIDTFKSRGRIKKI